MLEFVKCCEKNTKTKEREFKKAEQRKIKNSFLQFIHSLTHLATHSQQSSSIYFVLSIQYIKMN